MRLVAYIYGPTLDQLDRWRWSLDQIPWSLDDALWKTATAWTTSGPDNSQSCGCVNRVGLNVALYSTDNSQSCGRGKIKYRVMAIPVDDNSQPCGCASGKLRGYDWITRPM